MKKLVFMLLALFALFTLACSPPADDSADSADSGADTATAPEPEPEPEPLAAIAELKDAEGNAIGTASFTQVGDTVTFEAVLTTTLEDGEHGIHVHEVGDCTAPDFKSAGGHFNPAGVDHACPDTEPRHAGDFGNLTTTGGAATFSATSTDVTVAEGPNTVVGKAVVLHAGADDCTSQPSGAAGSRYACGVVVASGGGQEGSEAAGGDAGGDDAAGGDEGGES